MMRALPIARAVTMQALPRNTAPAAMMWAARLKRAAWWLAGGMVIALCVAGLLQLTDPRTLPIRRVTVEGSLQHLTREALAAAVAPYARGGFFTVDLDAVAAAARGLPWVDQASVRRLWPDGLRLTVIEQVPVARWDQRMLINARGELFTPPVTSWPGGLAMLAGPPGLERRVLSEQSALRQLLAAHRLRLQSLSVDARGAWRGRLSNGLILELGRLDIHARLQRWLRWHAHTPVPQPGMTAVRVDLRYSNGFAVRWQQEGADGA